MKDRDYKREKGKGNKRDGTMKKWKRGKRSKRDWTERKGKEEREIKEMGLK